MAKTHLRVSSSCIKRLVKAAAALTAERNHIGAFLLLWTTHEALIYRACAKALWIRGYKIADAEGHISKQDLRDHKLWDFFCRCCDSDQNNPPFEAEHPYMVLRRALLGISDTRNLVVHGARISGLASKNTLIKANTIITAIINKSAKAFEGATVITDAQGDKPLGDPLADLRKLKRKNYKPKEQLVSDDDQYVGPPSDLIITRAVANAVAAIDPNTLLPVEMERSPFSPTRSKKQNRRSPKTNLIVEHRRKFTFKPKP